MFARIARALQTTPNELLGFGAETKRSKRTALRDRLNAAADAMDDRELEITVVQAEAIAALSSCLIHSWGGLAEA